MKSKNIKILLWGVVLAITLGAFLIHFISILVVYNHIWAQVLLYSFLGLVITAFLAPLCHELGHIVVGLCCGFRLVSFTIGFLRFSFDKKLKISLVGFHEFGETVMLPKTPKNYPEKLRATTIAGLLVSVIYMLVGMGIVFLSKNFYVVLLFGISYHLSAYVLLVNALPFREDNDGSLLISYYVKGGVYSELVENVQNVEAEIMCGVEPKDVSSHLLMEFAPSYDYYSVLLKYYRYIAFLWRDEESAFKELFQISDLDKLPDSLYETVYKELFFASIIRGDTAFVLKHEDIVIGYLEKHESASDFRIHSAYRLFKGDNDWAKLIIESGLKTLRDTTGIEKYEKRLLVAMKNND